jgi:hypothetical protein
MDEESNSATPEAADSDAVKSALEKWTQARNEVEREARAGCATGGRVAPR